MLISAWAFALTSHAPFVRGLDNRKREYSMLIIFYLAFFFFGFHQLSKLLLLLGFYAVSQAVSRPSLSKLS